MDQIVFLSDILLALCVLMGFIWLFFDFFIFVLRGKE